MSPVHEPLTPAVARLLEAEREADEIVKRAREEAEKITAEAKGRAEEIRKRQSPADTRDAAASRARAERERQRSLILDRGQKQIETMRAAAQASLHEAAEKLLAVLVGES